MNASSSTSVTFIVHGNVAFSPVFGLTYLMTIVWFRLFFPFIYSLFIFFTCRIFIDILTLDFYLLCSLVSHCFNIHMFLSCQTPSSSSTLNCTNQDEAGNTNKGMLVDWLPKASNMDNPLVLINSRILLLIWWPNSILTWVSWGE